MKYKKGKQKKDTEKRARSKAFGKKRANYVCFYYLRKKKKKYCAV